MAQAEPAAAARIAAVPATAYFAALVALAAHSDSVTQSVYTAVHSVPSTAQVVRSDSAMRFVSLTAQAVRSDSVTRSVLAAVYFVLLIEQVVHSDSVTLSVYTVVRSVSLSAHAVHFDSASYFAVHSPAPAVPAAAPVRFAANTSDSCVPDVSPSFQDQSPSSAACAVPDPDTV